MKRGEAILHPHSLLEIAASEHPSPVALCSGSFGKGRPLPPRAQSPPCFGWAAAAFSPAASPRDMAQLCWMREPWNRLRSGALLVVG